MFESQIPQWLSRLANAITFNPLFLQALHQQLSRQFSALTNLNLDKDFILVNSVPDPFRILNSSGQYSLYGDLVGSRMGYEVQICWAVSESQQDWQPESEVGMNALEFWWANLPVAEILEEEHKKYTPLFPPKMFPFKVESEIGVWPHLRIVFTGKTIITAADYKKYLDILADAQTNWNKQEKQAGRIHAVGKITPVDESSFQVNIDFGSACLQGLEFMLHKIAIENTITAVRLYSC